MSGVKRDSVAAAEETAPQQLASSAAACVPDYARWGAVEEVAMSSLQRRAARQLSLAWQSAPHVTHCDLADISELEEVRKAWRAELPQAAGKLTAVAFVIKALGALLREYPRFNASVDMEQGRVFLKKHYHIGVAVDTEHGLIVPVIRNVDRKSVPALAAEVADLAARARRRKVMPDELAGGTFTVTNLGAIGGTTFTPIIRHPEVAILGLVRAREELSLRNGEVCSRLMLPLCLSYDHRVINGAEAAKFVQDLGGLLGKPQVLLG